MQKRKPVPSTDGKRKMLIELTRKLNKAIVEKQFEIEKETGRKPKKQDATIILFEELIDKNND
jgi:hypothetical protein